MRQPTPLPLLVRLLRLLSSTDADADAAVGDIIEAETQRRAAGSGPEWPSLTVNWHLLRAVAAGVFHGVPRFVRNAGLILRDSARALRAAPFHTLFAVVVLALGITAGTVTFSVVDAVVLKPLPFEQSDRLISIPTVGKDFKARITPEVFWRIHENPPAMESIAAYSTMSGVPVTVNGVTDEWKVRSSTADLFRVWRLSPAIGRFWTPDDEARGETDVAVLGYHLWQQQFHGSASALGAVVSWGTHSFRVIGVMSEASEPEELESFNAPVWIPLVIPKVNPQNRVSFGLTGRMRTGATPAQVADSVQQMAGTPDWRPDVMGLLDATVAPVRQWMMFALGAAALVVLIACVNVANLMLTRASKRTHELAIRTSLGASRRRIAMTVFMEGLLLSFGATAVAVLATFGGARLMRVFISNALPGLFRAATIAVSGRVLAASAICAVVTGVVFSILPALQTFRLPVIGLLKDADPTTATGRGRWRSIFLGTEVAGVAVLLVVSWLFVTSLVHALGVDLGIDRRNLVAINPRIEFHGSVDEVVRRVRETAGVADVSVSVGSGPPIVGRISAAAWVETSLRRVDPPGSSSTAPFTALMYRVTPNYFNVAGVPFRRGGTWTAASAAAVPPVVLDEQLAHEIFGDLDPLGRQLQVTEPAGVFTVVGLVPRVRPRGPEETAKPSVYFPLRPNPARNFASLFVRTSRPPELVARSLVDALQGLAPPSKDKYIFVADEALLRITATRRFTAGLMAVFGLVGLLIGAAGVYAVMTSFVVQQTREIGVRVALGATPGRIERSVVQLAARHLFVGLGLGLPVAWWFSRGFSALFFQVTAADASVYVGVTAILGGVGLLAAWIPARRAARIDPILTLRR